MSPLLTVKIHLFKFQFIKGKVPKLKLTETTPETEESVTGVKLNSHRMWDLQKSLHLSLVHS